MQRFPNSLSVLLDSTLADSEAIPLGDFAGGLVSIPTGSSITSLTFYASDSKAGTYRQIFDAANAAVSRTVAAARAYALPDECFAVRWLKMVPNADGTVVVTLKS